MFRLHQAVIFVVQTLPRLGLFVEFGAVCLISGCFALVRRLTRRREQRGGGGDA